MKPTNPEFQTKISILRDLLDRHGVVALLLRRVSSFAWATCGVASYVNTATTEGAASLVITREHLYLVTNNIEAPRLEQEEKLADQGWEFQVSPWDTPQQALQSLTSGLSLVSDVPFPGSKDISAEIAHLRAHLTQEEGERFRQLGHLCAETLSVVTQVIHPGLSEYQLAALVGGQAQQRGIQPIVNLIATDERTYHFRHPLPTEKILDKYAMLVLSGRRWGLVCSITRLVHFGPLTDDLRERISATAKVNATLIANTRPGRRLRDVLAQGQHAYTSVGFPDEWRQHHQGGVVGYEPREYLASPTSSDMIAQGQALAWNPSIAGAKMEDTILVGVQSNEILTSTKLWPEMCIQIPGQPYKVTCALALEV
ncbi:MAG: M24 family metallopeptidase [Chloroflexi bacterium]|nr:M24 family metallopeptidase [Chloroflexota bacterium]